MGRGLAPAGAAIDADALKAWGDVGVVHGLHLPSGSGARQERRPLGQSGGVESINPLGSGQIWRGFDVFLPCAPRKDEVKRRRRKHGMIGSKYIGIMAVLVAVGASSFY